MRMYIPALSTDLALSSLSTTGGFSVFAPGPLAAEDMEVLEYEAQTRAALASLEKLRDAEEAEPYGQTPALRRIVLCAQIDTELTASEGSPSEPQIVEMSVGPISWDHIVAILIDASDAETDVRTVIDAQDQDSADDAISHLWERALDWYDISERQTIVSIVAANGVS